MQRDHKVTLTFTAIVIQDKKSKGFTGYMLEMPEVIAEGNNEEELKVALFENLQTALEIRREEFQEGLKNDGDYSTESFELELA